MFKGSWKVDDNDEAVYIDAEEDADGADDKHVYSRWNELPDLVLEQIFWYLSMRHRYYASMVCRSWYRAFHLQYVWSRFELDDSSLTRRKFNYYYGWQHVLDHMRTQNCLTAIGRSIRHLVFEPMMNFFNLYEFMNMLSYFIERKDRYLIGAYIHSLKYTFPCNMAVREESERARIFGTGGKLLDGLKRLMGNLPLLRRLELIDLMLEPIEAQHLLDEVCVVAGMTLRTLIVVNPTRLQYQLLHAGVFLRLNVLVLSPQNLGDDLLELLGHTTLRHLHLLQNRYSPADGSVRAAHPRAWKQCRRNNPRLAVHLQVEGPRDRDVVWQEGACVRSVVYDSPHARVHSNALMRAVDLYRTDLCVYAHLSLPRFHSPRTFHERADSLLLMLVRQCPQLHTLVVRERISTATVLLLAHTGRCLQFFLVRRNAVILRSDWPRSPDWTTEFYHWLSSNAHSYQDTEREVSQILGHPWTMQSDSQFKLTKINLHYSPY